MKEDRIARARTVLRFLNGEGPLDGQWFNERPRGAGPYWWRKHLADVTAALASLPDDVSEDPWQPIETAPKDGQYLLWIATDDGGEIMKLERDHSGNWIYQGEPTFCASFYFEPTYWMPLPAPPAAIRKATA